MGLTVAIDIILFRFSKPSLESTPPSRCVSTFASGSTLRLLDFLPGYHRSGISLVILHARSSIFHHRWPFAKGRSLARVNYFPDDSFQNRCVFDRVCFSRLHTIDSNFIRKFRAMGKKIDLKSERFGNTSIFLSFEITVRQINFQFGQEVCITITLFSYWHNVESTLLCSLRGQLRPLYSLEIYWKFKLNEIQSKQHLSRIGTRVTTARSINVCCPFEPSFAFNRARVNFPSFFIYFHER